VTVPRGPTAGERVTRAVSSPDDNETLAAIGAVFPGWRAWRTRDGDLAAREGGSPPARAHARGESLAELTHAIETAITAGPPPNLCPAERVTLDALMAAPARLPVRAVSDITGLHLTATARTLATLHARGLATRHRDGRSWLYTRATAGSQPRESQPPGDCGSRA
jgi:IclR helix-turn-helix domain